MRGGCKYRGTADSIGFYERLKNMLCGLLINMQQ